MLTFAAEPKGILAPEWLAELVRLTCFVVPSLQTTPIWHQLTGRPPTEVIERPSEGVRMETGPFIAGVLVVSQQAGRIDVVYGANPPELGVVHLGATSEGLLHIGPAHAAITAFLNLISRFEGVVAGSYRIALAPVFIRQGGTVEIVNQYILDEVSLPVQEKDIDLIWQINRPRRASSFEGSLNVLTKWASVSIRKLGLIPQAASYLPSSSFAPTVIHFARLEIDINNNPPENSAEPFLDPISVVEEISSILSTINKRV